MALFGSKKNQITIEVEGMTCEHCEKRVEGAATSIAGVKSAKADHVKKQVVIKTGKAEVSKAAVAAAINGVGYRAKA